MKKILLFILITSHSLFADALPTSIKSTVKSVSNNIIQLDTNVPLGMSGIIIHDYGNGLSAITYTTISLGGGKASVQKHTAILHKNIPSIQTVVVAGDKVIFGNFYDNALIIAPNKTAYRQISKKFKRTWTHPDAFALAFMQEGKTHLDMGILEKFSKNNQIGLVLVLSSNQLFIIDPISKKLIGSTKMKSNQNTAKTPFYSRFEQIDLSVFNFKDKVYTPYFQSIKGLLKDAR